MEPLKIRVKISFLWISFAVCSSAAMIIWFLEPGILEQIITKKEMVRERLTELNIIFFAIWWVLPLSMSLLTQILNHNINNKLNLIVGVFCSILTIFYITNNIITGWFKAANFLILFFMFCLTVLIIHYTRKLSKEEY